MASLTILLVTSAICGFIGIWEYAVLFVSELHLWNNIVHQCSGRAAKMGIVFLVMRYMFLMWSIVFAVLAFSTSFTKDGSCKAASVFLLISLVILNASRSWMLASRADAIIRSVLPTSPNMRSWRLPLSYIIWTSGVLATLAVYATLVWSYAFRGQWAPKAYEGRCVSMDPPPGEVGIGANPMLYAYVMGVLFDLVCLASVLIGLDSLGRQSSSFHRFIAIFGRHSVVSYFLITVLQCFVLATIIHGEVVYESAVFGVQTAIIIRMLLAEQEEFGPYATDAARSKERKHVVVGGAGAGAAVDEAKGACTCGAAGTPATGTRRGSATVLARLGMEPSQRGSITSSMRGHAGSGNAWNADFKGDGRPSFSRPRGSLSSALAPRLSLGGGAAGARGTPAPRDPLSSPRDHQSMERLRSYSDLEKYNFPQDLSNPPPMLGRFDPISAASGGSPPRPRSTFGPASPLSLSSPHSPGGEKDNERFEVDPRTGSGLVWRAVSPSPSLEKDEELKPEVLKREDESATVPQWAASWGASLSESAERPNTSSTLASSSTMGELPVYATATTQAGMRQREQQTQTQTGSRELRVSMEQDVVRQASG